MNRIFLLAVVSVLAAGVPARLAWAGGGHHHYGHHHHGYHHHHSGFHFYLGLGSARHSYHHHYPYYSYRYYSYPQYSSPYYGYPYYSYGYYYPRYVYPSSRVSSYGYPSCTSYGVTYSIKPNPPSFDPGGQIDRFDETPKVEPAPEPLPLPKESGGSTGQPPTPPTRTVRFAVLQNAADSPIDSPRNALPSRRQPGQVLIDPSEADQLGPQLAVPKVRTLVTDQETPWVVE